MSVVTASITSAGREIPGTYEVLSIDVCHEVNRIPHAQIMLLDGDAAKQKFAISDSAFFEPGKEIEIKLRDAAGNAPEARIFKGVVIRHALEATEQGMRLIVEMKDAAIKLARQRRSAVYHGKTDSQIIAELVKSRGLAIGKQTPSKPIHAEMVQYYCTDWDFILSRADLHGLLVLAEHGTISLAAIEFDGPVKHQFEFGISEIFNFEIEIDADHQYDEVQSIAWDLQKQTLTQACKAKDFKLAQGNLNAATLAGAVGGKNGVLKTLSGAVPMDPHEIQAWADGALIRGRMAMIRGRIALPGRGDIHCLDLIEVAGMGQRFNGKTRVTGIRHRFDQHGWQTDVQFGLSATPFSAAPDVMDRPACGQLPGVNGLQVGVVTSNDDPAKASLVKVMLPAIDQKTGEVWARLATPDAGAGRGFFFRPEPGDEVIVGFFNDDPRQAVILGAMYGVKNRAPEAMAQGSDNNFAKGIITRSGLKITFHDADKPRLSIETPAANKIILDDQQQSIQLSDQHGNAIILNRDGIEIKSGKDLKLSASGNVSIAGRQVDVN